MGDGVWFSLGGAFPLCLLLALDHSVQPAIAGKLVAFMQGIGFIIAGLAPWFSGVLRSISGNYLMDWAFHALCVVGLMIITLRFAPVPFFAAVGQRGTMRRLFLRFVHAGCGLRRSLNFVGLISEAYQAIFII